MLAGETPQPLQSCTGLTAYNYPAVSTLALLLSCFHLMSFQCIAEAFIINLHVCDLTLRIAELHQGQAILPVLYHNVRQRVYRRSKDGIKTNIAMKIFQKIRHRIYPWETPLLTSSSLRAVLAVPPISVHFPCSSFLIHLTALVGIHSSSLHLTMSYTAPHWML